VLATPVAALVRVGTAINPALGFMAFTMFLLFAAQAWRAMKLYKLMLIST
jgi:hypothetical protein